MKKRNKEELSYPLFVLHQELEKLDRVRTVHICYKAEGVIRDVKQAIAILSGEGIQK